MVVRKERGAVIINEHNIWLCLNSKQTGQGVVVLCQQVLQTKQQNVLFVHVLSSDTYQGFLTRLIAGCIIIYKSQEKSLIFMMWQCCE